MADAVKYILDEADARGVPAVINASLGTYLGSHDGMDAAALFVDSLLSAAPGRVMVCASGNSGQFGVYHVENTVNADTSFTWYNYKPTPNAFGYGVVYFDLWADTANLSGVRYAIGADRVTPTFRFRGRTPFHSVTDKSGPNGPGHALEPERRPTCDRRLSRGAARRAVPSGSAYAAARFQRVQLPLHGHRIGSIRWVGVGHFRPFGYGLHRPSERGGIPGHRQLPRSRWEQAHGRFLGLFGPSAYRRQLLQ